MKFNDSHYYKAIYVDKLQEILSVLEPGDIVYPNPVGNLSILSEDLQHKGYIDIYGDFLELFEPYLTQQMLKEAKNAQD